MIFFRWVFFNIFYFGPAWVALTAAFGLRSGGSIFAAIFGIIELSLWISSALEIYHWKLRADQSMDLSSTFQWALQEEKAEERTKVFVIPGAHQFLFIVPWLMFKIFPWVFVDPITLSKLSEKELYHFCRTHKKRAGLGAFLHFWMAKHVSTWSDWALQLKATGSRWTVAIRWSLAAMIYCWCYVLAVICAVRDWDKPLNLLLSNTPSKGYETWLWNFLRST